MQSQVLLTSEGPLNEQDKYNVMFMKTRAWYSSKISKTASRALHEATQGSLLPNAALKSSALDPQQSLYESGRVAHL